MLAWLLAVATLFYVAPWPAVYGPALIGLAYLAWRRPDLALILVVLYAPFFMAPKHIGTKEFAPTEIFLGIAVLATAARAARRETRNNLAWEHLWSSPFLLPLTAFFLAGLASTLLAAVHAEAFRAFREVILEPCLLFVLLLLLAREVWMWWLLMATVVAAGLAVGFIA